MVAFSDNVQIASWLGWMFNDQLLLADINSYTLLRSELGFMAKIFAYHLSKSVKDGVTLACFAYDNIDLPPNLHAKIQAFL